MERSVSRRVSQVSSATTCLMDLYSASAEDKEIDGCFFDFQEMGLPPRLIKNLLTDLLESGQKAQSESQKASTWNEGEAVRKIPNHGSEIR